MERGIKRGYGTGPGPYSGPYNLTYTHISINKIKNHTAKIFTI